MGAYNFQGKVAVVTGGRRGIGYAVCQAMREAGATTVSGAKSVLELSLYENKCFQCDLSRPDRRSALISEMVKEFGRIDILVNNAGDNYYEDAENYPMEEWNRLIELMVTAPFDLCQQAFPYMKAQGGGKIINIASIAGMQGTRRTIAYTVAKHGLIGMTKCLSNEWTPYGINVNCVAPGWTETDMSKAMTNTEVMKARIPAGRFATPEEIANAVMWLASDESKYVCGSTLVVDGGWLAR